MHKHLSQPIHEAEERVQQVERLMAAGHQFHAFEAMEAANRDFGEFQPRLGMYYIWARLKEDGALGDVDSDGALEDFTFLMRHEGAFRSEGMVGRARMLHRKDSDNNAGEILFLCRQAVELDANVRAMMLMGFVFEHTKGDFDLARQWYLRAYAKGQPWGLRFYAYMQLKRKRFLTSALAMIIFWITKPLITRFCGEVAPFKQGPVGHQ